MDYFQPHIYLKKKLTDSTTIYYLGIHFLVEPGHHFVGIVPEYFIKEDDDHPLYKGKYKTKITIQYKEMDSHVHVAPYEMTLPIHQGLIQDGSNVAHRVEVEIDVEHLDGVRQEHGGSSTMHYPDGDGD